MWDWRELGREILEEFAQYGAIVPRVLPDGYTLLSEYRTWWTRHIAYIRMKEQDEYAYRRLLEMNKRYKRRKVREKIVKCQRCGDEIPFKPGKRRRKFCEECRR